MHFAHVRASLLATFVLLGAAGCGTKGPLTLPTGKPSAPLAETRLAPTNANHTSATGAAAR